MKKKETRAKLFPYCHWKTGKWCYINEKGKVVIPAIYDWVYLFREGVAQVMFNGKWCYINEKGKVIRWV